MKFQDKAVKWRQQLFGDKDSTIDFFRRGDEGWEYVNSIGIRYPEFIYCCLWSGEKTLMELHWAKGSPDVVDNKIAIYIKGEQKVIILKEEEAYGFGFKGETDASYNFLFYVRIGIGSKLIWSVATDNLCNMLSGVNETAPQTLDSLIGFLRRQGKSMGETQEGEV